MENNTTRLRNVFPDANTNGIGMQLPRTVRLNRLRTGVGRFRSNLHKWGVASFATYECGLEEQTADHVVSRCPLYCAPCGHVVGGARQKDHLLAGYNMPKHLAWFHLLNSAVVKG